MGASPDAAVAARCRAMIARSSRAFISRCAVVSRPMSSASCSAAAALSAPTRFAPEPRRVPHRKGGSTTQERDFDAHAATVRNLGAHAATSAGVADASASSKPASIRCHRESWS
jgi:hypothetical protein